MSYYSDVQLQAMMTDLESDGVERKQSFQGDAPKKYERLSVHLPMTWQGMVCLVWF